MDYMDREELLNKSNNSVFKLVNLAAKRALEIAEGQPKLVAEKTEAKSSTTALHEISEGKVQSKKNKAKE